ncbi:universal stress protein [Natronorubrum sp. FCH18a]|uniref:universal stress protein n=1 Tax=Natronorubrum sp. FCH18a TaxID=3447018 RepID=UPI003F50E672
MNERVLVPLNDSEPARNALREALEMFGSSEITILHVIELDTLSHGVSGPAAEELDETRKEEARELFEEAQTTADEYGVSLETTVERGDPADATVKTAEAIDADHIVMGSHARSGLSRVLVGSVAEEVIRTSPVSVTISRPRSDHGE